MVLFPNAKINLGLHVLSKRVDGYHDLETLFYPIGLKEGLEFVPNQLNTIRFNHSGLELDIDPEKNIVSKAYRLLAADYNLPGLDIHLHKVIPFGAGLGGGSSDAAFFLKGVNQFFSLGMNGEQLCKYASRLGADCSFFIDNKPALAAGIGDQLSEAPLSLKGLYLLLVKPPLGVGTAEAYAGIKPVRPPVPLNQLILQPIELWQQTIRNDFEETVFALYPLIGKIKARLMEMGALYASMSGSGSSVYGLFRQMPILNGTAFPENYFIWKEQLER